MTARPTAPADDPAAEAEPVPTVPERRPLRVAVLGPGGVGGLVAALLARAGEKVVCLAGPETAAVLEGRGVHVDSGRYGAFTAPVSASERLDGEVDVCFVTVKATSLDAALDRVPPQRLGRALLVPLLNGVEHVATLRRRYPEAAVAAATIRVESTRTGPGEIRHDSPFAALEIAVPPGGGPAVRRVAAHLEAAGLDVRVRDDAEDAVL